MKKHAHGRTPKTLHIELVADDPSNLRDALISHGWTPVEGSMKVERTGQAGVILGGLQQALPHTQEIRRFRKEDYLKAGRKS